MRPSLGLVAGCCLFLVSAVWSSPTGAPLSTCATLMPMHGDKVPQTSNPPYQLLPSKGQGRIRLIVGSPEGDGYEGFIILARDVETGELVGEFNNLPEASARHLECTPGLKVRPSSFIFTKDKRTSDSSFIYFLLIRVSRVAALQLRRLIYLLNPPSGFADLFLFFFLFFFLFVFFSNHQCLRNND
jgi:hypothetical protein